MGDDFFSRVRGYGPVCRIVPIWK